MGQVHPPTPVLLILATFSRYEEALEWALQQAQRHWGPLALASEIMPFRETRYYEQAMGGDLLKQLVAFERLVDPAVLVDCKLHSNLWEEAFQTSRTYPETRPLNLDPGYLTEAKLVLATTKDRDHRIYLGRGIYAEVTLHYQRGRGWQPHEWTYPDFRNPRYHEFFTRCRQYLRQHK